MRHYFVTLALLPTLQQCHTHVVVDAGATGAANDTGAGGSSTGGASATGGLVATGGTMATGGQPCAAVAMPDTPAPLAKGKQTKHPKLGRRKHRLAGRAPATEVKATTQCSVLHSPIDKKPLSQVDGSCTGHAAVDAISTEPFTDASHHNETDALTAYQGATCIDNACATCSCSACPKAYCPATHANDTGSYSSSAAQYMVNAGWLKGYTTADTLPQLETCLQSSTAMIGIDWRTSNWTLSSRGRIVVDMTTRLEGGHDLEGLGIDIDPPDTHVPDVIVMNSWGAWGWCFKSQMTPATPIDGTGCGYARISLNDLQNANFDADCMRP